MPDHNYFANLIWQIADLLRGPYRPLQYERVMLPMTVLRRFDCVLVPTKARVLAEYERRKGGRLNDEALDFEKLKGDPDHIEEHLVSYIKGFSANIRTILDFFEFETEIDGESGIRKWIIENDWLEAIIALPEQMFYNTGIGTYIWIVTNRKEKCRKGKIQLLDARAFYVPMRRSLGDKRRKIGEQEDGRDQVAEIVRLYGQFSDGDTSKLFDNTDFGYTRVTVERPLRLRYQMTVEDKARFLDACPHLLDDVQAIDKAIGREPQRAQTAFQSRIEELLRKRPPSRSFSVASSRRRPPRSSRWPGAAATRATSPTPTCVTSRTCR